MRSVSFVVYGTPAPQGSKRAYVNKATGRAHVVESSKKVKPWRQAVVAAALEFSAVPFEGPVRVRLGFAFTRPKGHLGTGRNAGHLKPSAPRYPAVRPDLDKLARSTLDGLADAGLIPDDSRIIALDLSKKYAAMAGCEVYIAKAGE